METTPDAFDPKRPADAGPGRDRLRRWVELALALAIPVVGVLALCRFFSPHWQTNDDIGMSMIAHGYGSVAQASPKLGFSNLLWGHFVRALPAVGGLLGYSVATFASLIAVGMALLHGLRLSTRSWLASIALVCGVLVLPVLFPQFTVNAGLLMIAALVCWRTYGQRGTWPWLLCGCVLAFASALVRNQEALLVFAIGCPLLPWGRLLRDRAARFAGVALVLAIGLATFANRQAYQGPEWQAFKALNPLRMRITDYGADKPLRRSPQLLRQQGLSQNDLNLLRAWFFVDPEIADPQRLKPMLAQIPPRYASEHRWQRGLKGVLVLGHPALLPLLLGGLLLALLYPDRRVLATWLLCIAAVFALAVVFRPGVLRVYVPLASLLFLAPFICNAATRDPPRWRWRVAQGIVVAAAVYSMAHAFAASRQSEVRDARIQRSMRALPQQPFVVWGGTFPFESLYPALQRADAIPALRFEVFGVFTLAPFSRNAAEEAKGNGFVQRLRGPDGVFIAASRQRFGFLKIYCRERLGGDLVELGGHQYGPLLVNRVRCATPNNG